MYLDILFSTFLIKFLLLVGCSLSKNNTQSLSITAGKVSFSSSVQLCCQNWDLPNGWQPWQWPVGIGNPCHGLRPAISNIDVWSIISTTAYSRSIGENNIFVLALSSYIVFKSPVHWTGKNWQLDWTELEKKLDLQSSSVIPRIVKLLWTEPN